MEAENHVEKTSPILLNVNHFGSAVGVLWFWSVLNHSVLKLFQMVICWHRLAWNTVIPGSVAEHS